MFFYVYHHLIKKVANLWLWKVHQCLSKSYVMLNANKRSCLWAATVQIFELLDLQTIFTTLTVHCTMSPDCSLPKNFKYLASNV